MLKISGLWLNKTTEGETYMAGTIGQVRIVILKNSFKKAGSKEPDYNMYFDEQKKKEELSLDEDANGVQGEVE